jgi:hypothetical protein
MIYECLKITDLNDGWKFIPSEDTEKLVYNEAEGFYPDKGGRLESPVISGVEEFLYYQLSFTSTVSVDSYWSVSFLDSNGNSVVSDCHSSIYAGENIKNIVVVYGREDCSHVKIIFQSKVNILISDVELKEISADDVAMWCDEIYSELPPIPALPSLSASEGTNLTPKTFQAMKTGIPWRVVMLGDSIINDTFNSNFQSLIKRSFSKSNMKFICSVRGSTGCWHYQEQEEFDKYIKDLKPDLLIIGGISHKNDIDAIRKVIIMAKEQIGCEIILTTGPLGEDLRKYDTKNKLQNLPRQCIASRESVMLKQVLADELNVEFIDLATQWHNYLGNSQKPWQWFNRDNVHGNDRGKQIVGRLLDQYFH